jgi:hypothetical protein
MERFLKRISEKGNVPLDFFSWHWYWTEPSDVSIKATRIRKLLEKYGYGKVESILNEWNYVKGWRDEEWIYSLKMEKSLKGSAFIASTMCMAQYEALDNLMFYDARPCGMNSLFDTDYVFERLKGYYPFYMFNQLYTQDHATPVLRESEDVWAVAAQGEEQNVMLSYYNDDDASPEKTVKVEFQNVTNENGVRLEYYCLDGEHDCELVREEIFTSTQFCSYVKMPLHSTYLLKIVALESK